MQIGSVIMENCMEISQKIENRIIIWSSDSAPGYWSKENTLHGKDTHKPTFIIYSSHNMEAT